MKKKKVRLGVIGLGPRGRHVAKLFLAHPECEITAICDKYDSNMERFASETGGNQFVRYNDFEKMLRSEVLDAAFIAVDPDIQVPLACHAMEKGIHVTTEVPAAYTIKQCWDLVNTVEKTGVRYQLCEQTRYWGFIRTWREMERRGEFGKVIFIEGEYLHYEAKWDYWVDPLTGELFYDPKPPEGRNVIPTWRHRSFRHPIYYLPHELSPMLSILDDRVTKVSCMGTRLGSYSAEGLENRDMEVALMHTEKDTVLRMAAGFTSPHGHRKETGAHWYQVMGTKCTAEWSRTVNDKPKLWTAEDGKWKDMDWAVEVAEASDFVKGSGHGGGDWWPVNAFISSIVKDAPAPMDVYKSVETSAPAILAAESSEKSGILLEVPDFRKRG